jgi:hypothetical protein
LWHIEVSTITFNLALYFCRTYIRFLAPSWSWASSEGSVAAPKLFKGVAYLRAQIRSINTEAKTESLYGEIKAGFLLLKATLIQVRVPEHSFEFSVVTRQFKFILDARHGIRPNSSIFFVPLICLRGDKTSNFLNNELLLELGYGAKERISGILVQSSEAEGSIQGPGIFQRVGFCEIHLYDGLTPEENNFEDYGELLDEDGFNELRRHRGRNTQLRDILII